jgi:capsular exopolysaccharide synthesis family protein
MPTGDLFGQSLDLRDATQLLGRQLKLIKLTVAFSAIFAFVIAMLITPQYVAETTLLLDARKTHVVDIGSVVSGLPIENSALRSEINIIKSRTVIDRVINQESLLTDNELLPQSTLLDWLNPLNWWATQPSEDDAAVRARSKLYTAISDRLQVSNDGRSYSITIAFRSQDPQKAARLANAFADAYLVDQLEAKFEATERASNWLDTRLAELKDKVQQSDKAVGEFREKSRLIEIDGNTISAQQMHDINVQLTKARGETSLAEATLRSVQAMIRANKSIDGASNVTASPVIQELRQQETALRREEADLSQKYGPLHPKIANIKAQMSDLRSKIAEEGQRVVQGLQNQMDIARAKQTELENQLKELEGRAGVELKDSVTLRQLQREADANRTLYEDFLSRFKETSAQKDLQVPDSRVIERASVPFKPSLPIKWLFLVAGAALGAVLGVVLAYLVEYFDRGFRSAAQVEESSGIPVVGIIPTLQGVSDMPPESYVLEKPLSNYSEALRTVRTAIHFSNVDVPPKAVMVTSAVPDEGKTTFCLSLGRSLAKAGNRILLIDADLRRPRLGPLMGLQDGSGGLASLLSGEQNFDQVVLHDPLIAGLDIITASSKAPNAQDLLGSLQMQKVIHEATGRYDLVIVDTPPVMAVSDAAMVARAVDTSLFLVRWAKTPRETSLLALKQLRSFNCRIAGIVMTQVNLAEHAKYGEGYFGGNYSEYYAN